MITHLLPAIRQIHLPNKPVRLTQLPANSKVATINQQKFYIAPSDVYYQETTDANNNVS